MHWAYLNSKLGLVTYVYIKRNLRSLHETKVMTYNNSSWSSSTIYYACLKLTWCTHGIEVMVMEAFKTIRGYVQHSLIWNIPCHHKSERYLGDCKMVNEIKHITSQMFVGIWDIVEKRLSCTQAENLAWIEHNNCSVQYFQGI